MPGWKEQCALHPTYVLLSIDGFETPTTDGSWSSNEGCTTKSSATLLSLLIQLLLKSLLYQET